MSSLLKFYQLIAKYHLKEYTYTTDTNLINTNEFLYKLTNVITRNYKRKIRTSLPLNDSMNLLELCLKTIYFYAEIIFINKIVA